jgi:hypothetical protein
MLTLTKFRKTVSKSCEKTLAWIGQLFHQSSLAVEARRERFAGAAATGTLRSPLNPAKNLPLFSLFGYPLVTFNTTGHAFWRNRIPLKAQRRPSGV